MKQLAHAHGGQVRAESAGVGAGSTFVLELPLRALKAPESVRPEHALQRRELVRNVAPPRLEHTKVLVVDDEWDARTMVSEMLAEMGATVHTAPSVNEAMAIFPKFRPHVSISDIAMPEEDGYALIRRVRALLRDDGGTAPAIALTAYARPEDAETALSAGFNLHMSKPVDLTRLVNAVAELAAGGNSRSAPSGARAKTGES